MNVAGVRPELPDSLYRADQVRELDRVAIQERGIPGIELMERAGRSAFAVMRSNYPDTQNISVLCGSGNNGGDGYIFARLAAENNLSCRVFSSSAAQQLRGDAATAAEKWLAAGNIIEDCSSPDLQQADIIIDALLGTGLDREVSGVYRQVIDAINTAGKKVLSIDIPSGLHADTGMAMGCAVKADLTISFIGLKQGLFTGAGPEYCGRILFSDLAVPDDIYQTIAPSAQLLDCRIINASLARRARHAHKGDFGHVLVIGGDYGFAGAVRMAAEAAARVGAGLVSVATRPEHALVIPQARPELMASGIHKPQQLKALLDRANVIAIGPGLGQSDWAQTLLAKVLETTIPLVIDADAINLIAQEPARSERWILTPHPGEAARLLATSSREIQANRYLAAGRLQEKYGGIIVLKGCGTIVADDAGQLWVCDGGNPGMASGGMGDVLTGIIAGLIAQGMTLSEAARLGVCLHARAGDQAALAGERGLLATDLLSELRRLVNP